MPDREAIEKLAERITLVNASPAHAQLLYDMFSGANTQKYNPVSVTSVARLARQLGQSGNTLSREAPFYRFFGRIDGVFFGTFVVKSLDWKNKKAEIGFCLLDAWQGRGLGTALVYKCVSKVFEESALDCLWATAHIANEASKRLMRRIGFDDCGLYDQELLIQGSPVPHILYQTTREQVRSLPRQGDGKP